MRELRERSLRWTAIAILALAALAGGGAAGAWIYAASHASLLASSRTMSARSGPDVVLAVRDLARLEAAEFHMERVIELTSTQRHFGLLEAEDSILLVAAADVIAGVDLGELREGDIVVDSEARVATITLPAPRVLLTRLDNQRTFVHSRQTDLLARRGEHLESEARREAERTLEASAIEAGILDRARARSSATVETLVRSLGYDDVRVRFRD